jgi:hypothetical protein
MEEMIMLQPNKTVSETFLFRGYRIFIFLLCMLLLNFSETIAAEYSLFVQTTAKEVMSPNSKKEETGIFKSAIKWIQVDLTKRIASADGIAKGDELVFDLFSDTPVRAVIDRVSVDVQGVVTVRGRLQNYPWGMC